MSEIIVTFASLILGTIFLIAGSTKVTQLQQFGKDIHQYRLFPKPVSTALGYILPFAELGLGLILISGSATVEGGIIAASILLMFMLAVGSAIRRKINISCACFGLLYREKVGLRTLIRDSLMLLLAFIAISEGSRHTSLAESFKTINEPSSILGVAGVVLALGIAVYLIKRADKTGYEAALALEEFGRT